MGLIVNGYDISEVFKNKMIYLHYHSCPSHNVHEYIITEKGNDCSTIEWFLCHLFDKSKGFIDELVEILVLWRLREKKLEKLIFNKEELELKFKKT